MNMSWVHSLKASPHRPSAANASLRPRWFRLVRTRVLQVAALIGFWRVGEWIVERTGVPIPGAILGLFIVLALLISGLLPVRTIQLGAKWLMSEMLLFFLPPMLALLNYPQFFGVLGLKLLLAIAMGILVVMLTTAFTIEFCVWASQSRRAHASK
jgi:holin-like protein